MHRHSMYRYPWYSAVMDSELLKGTLSLLILSLLSRKAMYGYEIAATVHRDTNGTFTWREGSLYPNLHKLQAEGMIVGEWEEKETGRKRRYYHITPKGKKALAEKVNSWSQLCQAVNCILEKSDGQA
ncbi:MAG TPA: PadR family transcriptional regulator [Gemmataceae bacterium]|nr:PadR family transcriptional regulator [Gemmataceae bacterium]